jgi:tetratricopeptide (TPR) repeat protein
VSRDLDDDDILTTDLKTRPDSGGSGAYGGTFGADEEMPLNGLGRYRREMKIGAGVLILLLAAGAAYLGFKDPHGFKIARGGEAAPAAPKPTAATAPAPPRPAAPAPTPPSPPAAAAPPAAPLPAARPALLPPETEAPAVARPAAGGGGEIAGGRPKTYERLVAEADHALENGSTTKAQKLYEEALRMQPDGVAATTGSAYLLLDKQKPLAAIGLFKRALTSAPSFPPALFGLGEAYRAHGDTASAVDAYKRYLAVAPSGPDAPAAKRQMRDLGEATPKSEAPPSPPTPSPGQPAP